MMKSLSTICATILFLLLVGVVSAQADPAKAANAYGATEAQHQKHIEMYKLGAKLWPIYCNHCHNAPNPEEEAPYQWDQIMMHMRTLENLPPQDEFAILEYLKTAR